MNYWLMKSISSVLGSGEVIFRINWMVFNEMNLIQVCI